MSNTGKTAARYIVVVCFMLMTCAASITAYADTPTAVPDTVPPPPIVQKFVSTILGAHSITADVLSVQSNGKTDTAHLSYVKPDKLLVADRAGSVKEALICNGPTVAQWNNTIFYKGKAPAHLADLEPPLDMQSIAAEFALEAFTTPDQFAVLPEYTDQGADPETGDEHLQAVTLHGTKDLYLRQSDGLPVLFVYSGKKSKITITFAAIKIDTAVPAILFAALPPSGLTAYVPQKDAPLLPIGSMAPDFTLATLDGSSVTLSALRGRAVIVDFWASWCPPCRMSMPHVQKIYNDYDHSQLTVLSVNTWDQRPFMQTFLAKHPWYTTTLLYDPDANASVASTKYMVQGIPSLYVIDPEGRIAASFVGYEPGDEDKVRAALTKLGLSTSPKPTDTNHVN